MAAPSATPRVKPTGQPMGDGHQTLITLGGNTNITFWEKTVTPPGIDGGDAIEVSTMHNTSWRTMRPRSLRTLTEASATVAYDPAVFDDIVARINVEDTITITFPTDAGTAPGLAFYGYLKSFTPTENSEGGQPEAEIVIVPTNWDYTNDEEAAPNYVASGSGTS